VVSENWNTFLADAEEEAEGYGLPKYVKKEFEAYLKCGILQYGFLRVQCDLVKTSDSSRFHAKSETSVRRAVGDE